MLESVSVIRQLSEQPPSPPPPQFVSLLQHQRYGHVYEIFILNIDVLLKRNSGAIC